MATGTGWLDNTLFVSESTIPLAANLNRQKRLFTAGKYTNLPSLAYPQLYWTILKTYDANNNEVTFLPSSPEEYLYSATVSGSTTATSMVALAVFNSANGTTPTDLYKVLAFKFEPKVAELTFLQGLNLTQFAGKILALGLAHYASAPTCDISITTTRMQDAVSATVVQPSITEFEVTPIFGSFGSTLYDTPGDSGNVLDNICGSPYICPANVTPLSLSAWVYTLDLLPSLSKFAIYNLAGVFICGTEEKTIPGPLQEITWTITGTPVTLTAGNPYYLVGWSGLNGAVRARSNPYGIDIFEGSTFYAPTFPATTAFGVAQVDIEAYIKCNYALYTNSPPTGTVVTP